MVSFCAGVFVGGWLTFIIMLVIIIRGLEKRRNNEKKI